MADVIPHSRKAIRRAQQLHRKIMVAVLGAVLIIVSTATTAVATGFNTVTVNVDGVTKTVKGWSSTVSDVLDNAGVTTTVHDVITPAVDAPISSGQTITVQRAHEFTVRQGNTQQTDWIVGRTVHDVATNVRAAHPGGELVVHRSGDFELPLTDDARTITIITPDGHHDVDVEGGQSVNRALADADITLSPLDQITAYPVDKGQLQLTITTVERSEVVETKSIDKDIKEVKDDSLYEGQEKVDTPGKDGKKQLRYAVERRNGKETSRELIGQSVVSKPVTEVKRVGTKPLPTGVDPTDMVPGAPPNPSAAQAVARTMLSDFGYGDSQYGCLVSLWNRESGWRYNAGNPSSGAYGIPQALPASKMASSGADYRTNPATQIHWGLGYIQGRYGTPCNAWGFFQSNNWY